jgi:prepilin-type N-terminal cleavage/methylation domain-containing protein
MNISMQRRLDIRMYRRTTGFTLTELLVTVVMVGIMASITSTSLASFLRIQQLNSATEKVLTAMAQAQQLAMSRSTTYISQFDTANNRYRTLDANGVPAPNATNPAWEPLPTGMIFNITAPINTTSLTNETAAGMTVRTLSFNNNGFSVQVDGLTPKLGTVALSFQDQNNTANVGLIWNPTVLGTLRQGCLVGGATLKAGRC